MPFKDAQEYREYRRRWRAQHRRHSAGQTASDSPPESPRPEAVQQEYPLDELGKLLVGAIERVGGLVMSAHFELPYAIARAETQLKDEERARLRQELKGLAERDEEFLKKHGAVLNFAARLSAVQAAKFESLILDFAGDRPLTFQQVLTLGAIIFAPLLLIIVLELISELWRS